MRAISQKIVTGRIYTSTRSVAGSSGTRGAGVGKGGGGGGSIREAGGAFGAMEAAREDQYFYNKQKEQLKELKNHLGEEIAFHEDQIKRHQEAVKRAKGRVKNMDQDLQKK